MRSFVHILQSYEVALAYLFGSQLEAGSAYLGGSPEKIKSGRDLDLGVVFLEFPKSPFLVYGDLYIEHGYFPIEPE
jgi:predicted nucleotidyltransferase